MSILVINASPNKGGNSDALAQILVNNKDYKTLYLCDYTIGFYGQHLENDQLSEVIDAMDKADTVIFASPMYWHNMAGSLRVVLDRFYGLVDQNHFAGKKLYFILQGAGPLQWQLNDAEYTIKRFAALYGFDYMGMVSNSNQANCLKIK